MEDDDRDGVRLSSNPGCSIRMIPQHIHPVKHMSVWIGGPPDLAVRWAPQYRSPSDPLGEVWPSYPDESHVSRFEFLESADTGRPGVISPLVIYPVCGDSSHLSVPESALKRHRELVAAIGRQDDTAQSSYSKHTQMSTPPSCSAFGGPSNPRHTPHSLTLARDHPM